MTTFLNIVRMRGRIRMFRVHYPSNTDPEIRWKDIQLEEDLLCGATERDLDEVDESTPENWDDLGDPASNAYFLSPDIEAPDEWDDADSVTVFDLGSDIWILVEDKNWDVIDNFPDSWKESAADWKFLE